MNSISDNTSIAPASAWSGRRLLTSAGAGGAFFWLSAFYFVYCARPMDWVPGLNYLPLAKITGGATVIALLLSTGQTQRRFRDLPKEAGYLLAIICLLYVSAVLSPVWKTGALLHTIEFSKLYIVWVLTFLLVTSFDQFRRVIFIQSACVPVVCLISIAKGYSTPRLQGILGGIYSNPNDLAFAIVLSMPFCLAFLLQAKNMFRKLLWFSGLLAMLAALFLTASRAGFIDLLFAGTVCLWHFGVKGKRFYLIASTLLVGALLMATVGGTLMDRFEAFSGDSQTSQSAYGSYVARKQLMERALDAIVHYPVFGVGVHDFPSYSGLWQPVHMTYMQIAAEGGIPVLILFLLFFRRGFTNLHQLLRRNDLTAEERLFVGALHSSLVGFVIGALFAPEAYQFFPYFAVVYTSALLAIVNEKQSAPVAVAATAASRWRLARAYTHASSPNTLAPVR